MKRKTRLEERKKHLRDKAHLVPPQYTEWIESGMRIEENCRKLGITADQYIDITGYGANYNNPADDPKAWKAIAQMVGVSEEAVVAILTIIQAEVARADGAKQH